MRTRQHDECICLHPPSCLSRRRQIHCFGVVATTSLFVSVLNVVLLVLKRLVCREDNSKGLRMSLTFVPDCSAACPKKANRGKTS